MNERKIYTPKKHKYLNNFLLCPFFVTVFAFKSPSYESPPVIEPSPITATTLYVAPVMSRAATIPRAAEIEVLACPAPNVSYALSVRLRNPDRP